MNPNDPEAVLRHLRHRVERHLVGQHASFERAMICVLAGGHLLIEGPPGVGKTLLVAILSRALGMLTGRVQFTVDLLPSDVLGFEIYNPQTNAFEFKPGPVFCQLLLADEINRASPRTQSALLQAMQERQVTIGGQTHDLPAPFMVLATQNPVDHVGTFELPAAQLDRFLLCHRMDYPSRTEESEIVQRNQNARATRATLRPATLFDEVREEEPVASRDTLAATVQRVREVIVPAILREHVVAVVRKTREHKEIETGCGPRACLALIQAMQARALWCGRSKASYDDLIELAEDALCHRLVLRQAGLSSAREIRENKRRVAEECLNV